MAFEPSKYQLDIFEFVKSGTGSAIVEAVAGSGKSTTIVQASKLIPDGQSAAFLAFNKSIAEELKSKLPLNVAAQTLNSLGHRAFTRHAGKFLKVDANKTRTLMQEQERVASWSEETHQIWTTNRPEITKLVSLAKAHGIVPVAVRGASGLTPDRTDVWLDLIGHYGLDVEDAEAPTVVDLARDVLTVSLRRTDLIDFDDQLYMTVVFNIQMPRYDWLFVDESQDLSPIQHALLRKALKPGGRLIAVGDSHQAIYGWRGADTSSMANLAAAFSCKKLPLSISYRCPKLVVEYARQYMPTIEPAATAAAGELRCLTEYTPEDFRQDDLIVCRNTKPLVAMAFAMIRARVPVNVMGRDIGNGLVALLDRIDRRKKQRNIHGPKGLVEKLEKFRAREIEKYIGKGEEDKAQQVEDKIDTLNVFIDQSDAETTDDLTREVSRFFTEQAGDRLTLATVHKAKGLEADRVFILDDFLMPSRYARKDWQTEQERNIQYVAYTRAKKELVFIESKRLVTGRMIADINRSISGAAK